MPGEAAAEPEPVVIREVRLRAGFTALYPSITPGVWMPAAEVSAIVLFQRYTVEGPEALLGRPLRDDHFEFRGGWQRGTQGELRTRTEDADAVPPQRPTGRRRTRTSNGVSG